VTQRLAHRGFRILDRTLAVTREAVINPGVGPGWVELKGGGEGLFRAGWLTNREPCLSVRVMRSRQMRRRVAGLTGGMQGSVKVAASHVGGKRPQAGLTSIVGIEVEHDATACSASGLAYRGHPIRTADDDAETLRRLNV
jgi:hypothetical protein